MTVVDRVLVGKELKADKHAAVLNFQKSNRNSVVRFSFRRDGETHGFSFSLNHAKGHVFRVNVHLYIVVADLRRIGLAEQQIPDH